jgi:EAL domain-containing protein (putative c-di-GMP-specific phosphodiesterase class I)
MVDLSHRLGAQTVVEGVETAQHLELAQQAGANFVQVFFSGCRFDVRHRITGLMSA